MKHHFFLLTLVISPVLAVQAASPIVFRGDSLEMNTEFKRKSCGNSPKEMVEISGMACSRVTPGFLWAQSDDNYRVIAMTEKGKIQYDITFKDKPSRSDWEDMCSGVYQGKQTLFVGAFGDNSARHMTDNYIFYMEEPEIPQEYAKNDNHLSTFSSRRFVCGRSVSGSFSAAVLQPRLSAYKIALFPQKSAILFAHIKKK